MKIYASCIQYNFPKLGNLHTFQSEHIFFQQFFRSFQELSNFMEHKTTNPEIFTSTFQRVDFQKLCV